MHNQLLVGLNFHYTIKLILRPLLTLRFWNIKTGADEFYVYKEILLLVQHYFLKSRLV